MTDTTGLLVKEDGSLEAVVLETAADGSNLHAMRKVMDVRTVDVVRLNGDIDCWVDDESVMVAEPVLNPVLSVMTTLLGDYPMQLFGVGLFLAVDARTGASVSLDDVQMKMVQTAYETAHKAVYGFSV